MKDRDQSALDLIKIVNAGRDNIKISNIPQVKEEIAKERAAKKEKAKEKQIKELDKKLRHINFTIEFKIDDIMPRITGSKFSQTGGFGRMNSSKLSKGGADQDVLDIVGNNKVISVGLSQYQLTIRKSGPSLSINVGGFKLATHYSFGIIAQFMEKNKVFMQTYIDNLKV